MARNTLAAASIVLLSLCAFTAPAQAHTTATILIQTAPPPPRYEAAPPPRRSMVWVPGHWEWRGRHHVWIDGHWIKGRPGYRSHAPTLPPGWSRAAGGICGPAAGTATTTVTACPTGAIISRATPTATETGAPPTLYKHLS